MMRKTKARKMILLVAGFSSKGRSENSSSPVIMTVALRSDVATLEKESDFSSSGAAAAGSVSGAFF